MGLEPCSHSESWLSKDYGRASSQPLYPAGYPGMHCPLLCVPHLPLSLSFTSDLQNIFSVQWREHSTCLSNTTVPLLITVSRFLVLFCCYLRSRCIQGWVGTPDRKNHLEYLGVDDRIILKWIFKQLDGKAWTGLMWLRIGTGGGPLWMRRWTFGFNKIRGISWLVDLLASQEAV
jgi:hypothetical protein